MAKLRGYRKYLASIIIAFGLTWLTGYLETDSLLSYPPIVYYGFIIEWKVKAEGETRYLWANFFALYFFVAFFLCFTVAVKSRLRERKLP